MQLPEDSPAAQAAGHIILTALGHHPIFMSAALPKRVFPPLFNCYQGGMAFGNHVDNSVRTIARTGAHIRTDVSCTLFLAEPDSYDGGELIVEDTYGVHSVKLPAGHAVIYPSTSLHRVEPVTQGARVASFFWLQSMIRDDSKRALLFDMDMNIMRLRCKTRPRHQRCQKHSRGGTSPSGCRNPRSLGRGGSQCELDTLAMVMVLEAFEAELK